MYSCMQQSISPPNDDPYFLFYTKKTDKVALAPGSLLLDYQHPKTRGCITSTMLVSEKKEEHLSFFGGEPLKRESWKHNLKSH